MSPASTGPAERTASSRYAEAFWWVLPVPLGLVAGAVALIRHPMDIPEPLRQPIEVGMLLAVIVGALTWKAVGLGYSWVSGFLTGLGLLAFYLVVWLVDRSVNR